MSSAVWLRHRNADDVAVADGPLVVGLPRPPRTSKCNRTEHRMFSFITMNWRGLSTHHLPHDRRTHRRHNDGSRTPDRSPVRHRVVSHRRQNQRCRTHRTLPRPPRLELPPGGHIKRMTNPAGSPNKGERHLHKCDRCSRLSAHKVHPPSTTSA